MLGLNCVLSFTDLPAVPMVNLIFAISALSTNAIEKFQKMKDIIKTMVDEYGKERIHYSLIVFGEVPSVELRFSRMFDTDNQLKAFLDSKGRATDGAALDKALEKAAELFQEYEREGAKKVEDTPERSDDLSAFYLCPRIRFVNKSGRQILALKLVLRKLRRSHSRKLIEMINGDLSIYRLACVQHVQPLPNKVKLQLSFNWKLWTYGLDLT